MFVLVDFVHYNKDFIKSRCVKSSRFCSLHYTKILARLKKIVCYSIARTLLYRGSLNRGSTVFYVEIRGKKLEMKNEFSQ